MLRRYLIPALIIGLAATGAANAQDDPAAEEQVPQIGDSGPPPFDEGLLRISEILGAMHYLRQICDSDEGALWRNEMQALLNAENPDPQRRARFIDRFNRGHDSFSAVYRTCTPAATLAIDLYLAEGARIARDIAARYGKEP